MFGQAQSFDGLDDQVVIGNTTSLDLTTNELTLSAWVNYDFNTNLVGGSDVLWEGVVSKGGYNQGY